MSERSEAEARAALQEAETLLARLRDPKTLLATLPEACGYDFEGLVAAITNGTVWTEGHDKLVRDGRCGGEP